MKRDFASKKQGHSGRSYIQCLEEQLPQFYEPGMMFMHDNIPLHNTNSVKKRLYLYGIAILIDWPPYSPKLNTIEPLWWHLED